MTKRDLEPCYCDAYPFPHKPSGGVCYYREGEFDALEANGSMLDEIADDPRHGQAADLNRKPTT